MRFWITAITILIIDQLSKLWVASHLALGESITVIDGVFNLTYINNRGAAFGIMQGQSWFFLAIAVIVSAALIYYYFRYPIKPWGQYTMGMIVGGTLGNVIDRLFLGAVRDFFSIGWFPIFNIADMAITAGGALVMLYLLLDDSKEQNS